MLGLMGMKRIQALNDEAHHCYREKPAGEGEEGALKGEDRKEAERNREAARVWIAGLEAVQRKLGLQRVMDLSATPFFLRGSGYREGVLFPWTASDFSLMDAIESGIVKLPRVPVADNIPGGERPKFRNLWEHIRPKMRKRGCGEASGLDPLSVPVELTCVELGGAPLIAAGFADPVLDRLQVRVEQRTALAGQIGHLEPLPRPALRPSGLSGRVQRQLASSRAAGCRVKKAPSDT